MGGLQVYRTDFFNYFCFIVCWFRCIQGGHICNSSIILQYKSNRPTLHPRGEYTLFNYNRNVRTMIVLTNS